MKFSCSSCVRRLRDDQTAQLAKQLANSISSLISVSFKANEDFGYGPSHNAYKPKSGKIPGTYSKENKM